MGAKLVQFTVKAFPKTRAIGKSVVLIEGAVSPEDRSIENLWESMARDGSLDLLSHLPRRAVPDGDTVGWMGDFYPPDMHFTYLAGVLFEADTLAPEGFVYRDIAAGEMAVAWIQQTEGPEGGEIHANASGINGQAMKEHGYEYDGSRGPYEIEYQSFERFYAPLERGEQPILDFYSPCKKIKPSS